MLRPERPPIAGNKPPQTGLPESLHHKDVEEVAEKMHQAAETPPDGPLEG